MTTTADRIAELTAAWERAVNYGELPECQHRASDYILSEDDWRFGLSDDEAAELVALIEQQDENQQRAKRIARRAYAAHDPGYPLPSVVMDMLTAAALAALTEKENA